MVIFAELVSFLWPALAKLFAYLITFHNDSYSHP